MRRVPYLRFLETAFAVSLACAIAATGTTAAAAPDATPRASTVQGTLTIQGSITVDNSYDGRVNCGDGVRSDQSVTVHLSLKPRRIIIASALGAASGTVMGGTSSVTIGQNSFEYSPPSCNGDPGVAFGEAPTAPICEPSQGKAMIMLTQNPPPGTLDPVPLQYPRLHLVVSAADNTGGLNADCPQYWPQLGSGPGEITGLSLGESRLWSMYLPSGLQVKGTTGLAKAHKGAKIRRVINVTGPCEAMVGTASPARSRPEVTPAEGEPIQSCEMSGRFLLTLTKR